MHPKVIILSIASGLFLVGCTGANPNANVTVANSSNTQAGAPGPARSESSSITHGPSSGALPVASGHGSLPQGASSAAGTESSGPDTSALDTKIKQAESRARAGNATEADRKAAAAAYLERANVYYSAQTSSLYKFALGDFRRVLKYDPSNAEAKVKSEQIISIYKSMGRPVPENGLEP